MAFLDSLFSICFMNHKAQLLMSTITEGKWGYLFVLESVGEVGQ